METINALKTLVKPHNEAAHPRKQGFIIPVLAGLTAYGAAASAMLAVCITNFS